MKDIKIRAWNTSENIMLPSACFWSWLRSVNGDKYNIQEMEDDLVLMLYTGLNDKNGNDVFESDVVKIDGRGLYRVIYIDDSMKFFFQTLTGDSGEFRAGSENIEVVGDIYQNPELLETKED